MPAAGSQAKEVPALSDHQQRRFDSAMSTIANKATKKIILQTLQAVHTSGWSYGYDAGHRDGVEDSDPIVD